MAGKATQLRRRNRLNRRPQRKRQGERALSGCSPAQNTVPMVIHHLQRLTPALANSRFAVAGQQTLQQLWLGSHC